MFSQYNEFSSTRLNCRCRTREPSSDPEGAPRWGRISAHTAIAQCCQKDVLKGRVKYINHSTVPTISTTCPQRVSEIHKNGSAPSRDNLPKQQTLINIRHFNISLLSEQKCIILIQLLALHTVKDLTFNPVLGIKKS